MREFIPSFHLDYTAEQKLSNEWFYEAIKYCYYNSGNKSLVFGKNIKEIEAYATGDFSMKPFKKMFKSEKKAGEVERADSEFDDMIYEPLPLIPTKVDSAHSIVDKIPFEVEVRANDALAYEKKEKDINLLKNKPEVEAELNTVTQSLGLGTIDLGGTQYSDTPFSESPYGLDLNDPEDESVFKNMLYSLSVESAYETALQGFWDNKRFDDLKSLLIKDQIYLGVSCSKAYISSITGLPDYGYIHPSRPYLPDSHYNDFKDNSHRFFFEDITPLELFNRFGDEIGSRDRLNEMINGVDCGYCKKNGINSIPVENFDSKKIELVYCEIKSIDFIGVKRRKEKSRFYCLVGGEESKKCDEKLWGQNTYCAYWLKNTPYFFSKSALDFAFREQGREAYQTFSTVIYRSKRKSIVELAIAENKKAQIAAIKINMSVAKSMPSGKYIDIKYLIKAYSTLSAGESQYSLDSLIDMYLRENNMIADSSDMEGNEGQARPFDRTKGGLDLQELSGYLQVILDAEAKISRYTGINEQLTGQSANPTGLIGMQKLLINSSLNALYYINRAIEVQAQCFVSIWASAVRDAIKAGGKRRQAIERMIGDKKVELLRDLSDLPLHSFSTKVVITQREEERQKFELDMAFMKQQGVLTVVDDFILSAISNPKDRRAFLAVRFKKWQQRQDMERMQAYEQQQILTKQHGDNKIGEIGAKSQAKQAEIAAQGEVSAALINMANQLGMGEKELDAALRKDLQQDRGRMQADKAINQLKIKAQLDNEKPVSLL